MNWSAVFIARPIGTLLLALGLVLAGAVAYTRMPVAPLPQVEFPVISVSASLPGASPETMAATVATPLERALGAIAGINEITSTSSLGSTRVTLQFDLNRSIDDAAFEVQAAINSARSQLPSSLPNNPTYRKANPADSPIVVIALTSPTATQSQMFDIASTVLAQKIAQVRGVGNVTVGGSSLPAVRVEVDPAALNQRGLGLDQVRSALAGANSNRPKGSVEDGDRQWWIYSNDQARSAREYVPLIVSIKDGAAIRLGDIARVSDSVQDLKNSGSADGVPAVLLMVYREPNANIIETADRVDALLPVLRDIIPPSMNLQVSLERTSTIRASIREVQKTLLIAVALVVFVVLAFLRSPRATLIPAAAVPVSLIATFSVMYLAGFSINNLTLMAMIIAAGFVVDDAIVVLENTARHVEGGMAPAQAALLGAREVGATVVSMSLSLVAVFIPILLMGDLVGRLFREFAVTLSVAVLISMVVSLTLTPMMCARLLVAPRQPAPAAAGRPPPRPWLDRAGAAVLRGYGASLSWALRHSFITLLVLIATVVLNVWLYGTIPKGFFPDQDSGKLMGSMRGDQSSSFQLTRQKMQIFVDGVRADPAVASVTATTGGGTRATGTLFVQLKPLAERGETARQVVDRLRQLFRVPGARLSLWPIQDVRSGGRMGTGSYQYTLRGDDIEQLRTWTQRLENALLASPVLADVDSDVEARGLQVNVVIDRPTAARLGISPDLIDTTLGNAFSQSIVSTIYEQQNQYRVVMEVDPRYAEGPESLRQVHVITATGSRVPLTAFAHYEYVNTPLSVNHQGQFAASTISFSLPEGRSLSEATAVIDDAVARIGMPTSIFGSFEGTARNFRSATSNQPLLILAAIITMYIVLGVLYESTIHPLTILSTLPSAGVGALLALKLFDTEFSLIALIAVFLLIGIVKKNAIMMVDFALAAQRERGLAPRDAIHGAALLRLRPILMTTLAAMLGAVPLAIGAGDGAELRTPLGIAIVGGLLVSQLLTLYTTPVVYLYLDRLRLWRERRQAAAIARRAAAAARAPRTPRPPAAGAAAARPAPGQAEG
ncbi:MAG: efflux RND transporter permease subunit [Lautropia sp.]